MEISRSPANSEDIPWETKQQSIIIRTKGRNTRIMMDVCLSPISEAAPP